MIKLIATDMDGTLFREDGTLPSGFFEMLQTLSEKDVYFVIASGRQYFTLLNDFIDVKDKLVFIAENGSLAMRNGEELFSLSLDREDVVKIVEDVRKVDGCELVVCGKNSAYIETDNLELSDNVFTFYLKCQKLDDILKFDDDILKVAVYDFECSESHAHKILHPKWGEKYNVIVSGKNWMDFGRLDVDKGVALKKIQEILGVSIDETLVFGDYFNDVSMFKNAKYSYAMDNAVDGVKAEASFVAPSNKDEGVMQIIKKYIDEGLI